MKIRKYVITCLYSLIVFCSSASAQNTGDKTNLQLRLEEGKTYKFKMVTEQKIAQEVQGNTMDMTQTMGFGYRYDIEKVDPDGTITIKITHDSVVFRMESAMMQLDYDSEKSTETDNPMAKGFAAFVGESYACKIASDGTVKEVTGIEEMMANVIKKMGLTEGPEGDAAKKGLETQLGNTSDTIKSLFAFYPDKPVGIGDSWTKSINIRTGFPMISDTKYTLTGRKNGVAVLEMHSTITTDPDAEPTDMGQMTIQYDISGESNGTLEVDEATGWNKRSKNTLNINGTIHMSGNPQMPEGMTIPLSVEGIITLETVE